MPRFSRSSFFLLFLGIVSFYPLLISAEGFSKVRYQVFPPDTCTIADKLIFLESSIFVGNYNCFDPVTYKSSSGVAVISPDGAQYYQHPLKGTVQFVKKLNENLILAFVESYGGGSYAVHSFNVAIREWDTTPLVSYKYLIPKGELQWEVDLSLIRNSPIIDSNSILIDRSRSDYDPGTGNPITIYQRLIVRGDNQAEVLPNMEKLRYGLGILPSGLVTGTCFLSKQKESMCACSLLGGECIKCPNRSNYSPSIQGLLTGQNVAYGAVFGSFKGQGQYQPAFWNFRGNSCSLKLLKPPPTQRHSSDNADVRAMNNKLMAVGIVSNSEKVGLTDFVLWRSPTAKPVSLYSNLSKAEKKFGAAFYLNEKGQIGAVRRTLEKTDLSFLVLTPTPRSRRGMRGVSGSTSP